jgi:hypothetical protein
VEPTLASWRRMGMKTAPHVPQLAHTPIPVS